MENYKYANLSANKIEKLIKKNLKKLHELLDIEHKIYNGESKMYWNERRELCEYNLRGFGSYTLFIEPKQHRDEPEKYKLLKKIHALHQIKEFKRLFDDSDSDEE